MGGVRVNLLASRLGVAIGALLFVIGFGLVVGLGAALMAAGVLAAVGSMLLVDVGPVGTDRE